jgi:hypothetical protein
MNPAFARGDLKPHAKTFIQSTGGRYAPIAHHIAYFAAK